jgi:hypothetical protein
MMTVLGNTNIKKRQTDMLGRFPLAHAMKTMAITGVSMFAIILPAAALGEQPTTPPEITPPAGNVLFLEDHASGTQNYICLPSTNGSSNMWVFFSPQATLYVNPGNHNKKQVLTHFLSPVPAANANASPEAACTLSGETGEVSCPTWQSSLDSSVVWGGEIGSISAGTDASCPNTGSIPCLLLNAVATRRGQSDVDLLSRTTFIQRLNTKGGSAPTGSCKVGDQALVPYTADYYFYQAEHEDPDQSDR